MPQNRLQGGCVSCPPLKRHNRHGLPEVLYQHLPGGSRLIRWQCKRNPVIAAICQRLMHIHHVLNTGHDFELAPPPAELKLAARRSLARACNRHAVPGLRETCGQVAAFGAATVDQNLHPALIFRCVWCCYHSARGAAATKEGSLCKLPSLCRMMW